MPEIVATLSRTSWQWASDAALKFASINNAIHPESLFSAIRRYHLLELLNSDEGSQVVQKIEKLRELNEALQTIKTLSAGKGLDTVIKVDTGNVDTASKRIKKSVREAQSELNRGGGKGFQVTFIRSKSNLCNI